VSTARKLHAVTQRYNIPLLINDRIDVALAIGCEGVHIGQDDLGMFMLLNIFPPFPNLNET
jgi:thiamine-phosphate diphosphorylase/hydroxyethylthiazole kinase